MKSKTHHADITSLAVQIASLSAAIAASPFCPMAPRRIQGYERSNAAITTRNRIHQWLVKTGQSTIAQIAEATTMKYSTVCEHIRLLREEGRAAICHAGNQRTYKAIVR